MQKAQQAVMGHKGDKTTDLAQETKEVSAKVRLTTDYGVKQTSADDWLKVVNDDRTGPMLLEDPFGRERVRTRCIREYGILLSWSSPIC